MAYVLLDDQKLDTTDNPSTDVTPSGYALLTGDKAKGSAANEKATLTTVQHDSDHVIDMGAGSDLFVFGAGDQNKVNAIVKMGDQVGDVDTVYLTHTLSDYEFKVNSDGGIKIHYIGDGDGAAVTFYGADKFVFRNIEDNGDQNPGANHQNVDFSAQALIDAINASTHLA